MVSGVLGHGGRVVIVATGAQLKTGSDGSLCRGVRATGWSSKILGASLSTHSKLAEGWPLLWDPLSKD